MTESNGNFANIPLGSASESGVLNTNITNLVTAHIADEESNKGFLIKSITEGGHPWLQLNSADHYDLGNVPVLVVRSSQPSQKSFVKVKKKLDGAFVQLASDNKLRYIYDEEYNDLDGELTYTVYNDRHEAVMTETDQTQAIAYGQNRLVLALDVCWTDGNYYVLEVTNEKKEKWYVKFKTHYTPLRHRVACSSASSGTHSGGVGTIGTSGSTGGSNPGGGTSSGSSQTGTPSGTPAQ